MESNHKNGKEQIMETSETIDSAVARERIMEDLRALAHDAEDLLKATAGDVSEKTKEARERLGAALHRAKIAYQDVQGQTIAAAKAAAKTTDKVIRDHPYESIGVAFGVGLLIGVLVTRK
jgi:ElaB/YqjD/DUF883 family membrane-anchored ribosome-binding protein